MLKFIGRIGCLAVILFVIFLFVAFTGGGEKFRELGEKTGGFVQAVADKLAEKADRIKGTGDGVTRKVKKWSKQDEKLEDK